MKKIYLSGAMRGHEEKEITERFKAWERALLLSLPDNWCVVNPAELYPGETTEAFTNDELLAIDIAILKTCDAIFMLPGWEDSEGARREVNIAIENGLSVQGFASDVEAD